MRVSFDLDEVLFVDPNKYEIENPPRGLAGMLFKERLRKGTIRLIHELQRRGYEVWIYTSSYRSVFYLERLFKQYGVVFDGIVNAERHNREVQRTHNQRLPQKLPPHYQISLHIDDEESVIKNSVSYGFHALRVYDPDDDFCDPKVGMNESIVEKYVNEAEKTLKDGGECFEEPIMVAKLSDGEYMIINGHHRWAAAIKMSLDKVRVVIANPGEENLVGLL